jgi:uncharacterized protein HemX
MPVAVADTKKVQTLINAAGYEALAIRAAITRLKAVRALYNTAAPDATGTPLEGNLAAVSNAIDSIDVLMNTTDSVVWDGMVAAIVPSHRGEALD